MDDVKRTPSEKTYCIGCDHPIEKDGTCVKGCSYGEARKRLMALGAELKEAENE